ncbi:MAG: TIGR03915 family putative DNA repair protein [Acutalibacteraceae bacterium]|jgi:probable DNA metabolism protein
MADRDLTLLYDGSFDGLMSAVFDAYRRRPRPVAILPESSCQIQFGRRYLAVAADPEKADRVVRGIREKIGEFAYEKVWLASLADIPDVSQTIYVYLQWGFEIGSVIRLRLADDRALALDKAVAIVTRESEHLREFLRFSEMDGGVFYGEISPRHQVLPLLMPHFAERFNDQPFLIQDRTHQLAGVAKDGKWYITDSSSFTMPALAAREEAIRYLWKTFYQKVAIEERINPGLRRQHMPKKYWKHMTEMDPRPMKPPATPYQPAPPKPLPDGVSPPPLPFPGLRVLADPR